MIDLLIKEDEIVRRRIFFTRPRQKDQTRVSVVEVFYSLIGLTEVVCHHLVFILHIFTWGKLT